jgi:hypothetical protein
MRKMSGGESLFPFVPVLLVRLLARPPFLEQHTGYFQ